MDDLDNLEILFVVWAFLFQCILILYFALRKWKVSTAMQYGWTVYAMSIPAVLVSVFLLASGMEVSFWLGDSSTSHGHSLAT